MEASEYRQLREEAGLTQAALAQSLEVSRETIVRRETSGKIPLEAALAIRALARPGVEKLPKLMFGKLLAEIYRIQNRMEIPTSGSGTTIFGLLRGIEECIDEELERLTLISNEKIAAFREILNEIEMDPKSLFNFKGYYDIRKAVESAGINRGEAIQILKYFRASDQYLDVIAKMDSIDSPIECRKFELHPDEQ